MVVKAVVWFSFASLEFNFRVQFSIEEKLHFCFELQGLQRRSIKFSENNTKTLDVTAYVETVDVLCAFLLYFYMECKWGGNDVSEWSWGGVLGRW